MKPLSSRQRDWLMRAIKLVVFVSVVWGVGVTLWREWDKFRRYDLRVDYAWLAASGVFYLLGLVPSTLYFQRIMVQAGQDVRPFEAIRAYYISQLGKYVFGKAMAIVLRAGMLPRARPEGTVLTAAVFLETLGYMAVGSLTAVLIVIFDDEPGNEHHGRRLAIALAMFLITGLTAWPPLFKHLVRLVGLGKINPTVVPKMARIRVQTTLGGWLAIAAGWWLQGLSLWSILRAMGQAPGPFWFHWPLHTAAVAMAVVIGFLTLLPAGIGSRELVLLRVIGPVYGDPVAVVAAVLLRLVWLVAEVGVSSILYFMGPRLTRASVAEVDSRIAGSAAEAPADSAADDHD